MICPNCGAKLRSMITPSPIVEHDLIEGYECPECHYNSVDSTDEPLPDPEDED